MSTERSRIISLTLLGVLVAAGAYFLSGREEVPAPESSLTPTDTDPPTDALKPRAGREPAQTLAETDDEEGQGATAPNKVAHLGSEVWKDEADPDEADVLPSTFESLAQEALEFPNMKEIDPSDSSYDPRLEAQQAFAPMEQDLMEADPLGPETWREALEAHQLRNSGVSKRAQFLRKSGHPELAEELMVEWGRVYGSWQARAYGRAGPPGYKSPPR
jgi:hypothetical protein